MNNNNHKNILVVAAHPDDEVLGCGGTIARHANAGDHVSLLVMTNGVTARSDASDAAVNKRACALKEASHILGVSQFRQLDFPDNQMDAVPLLEIIRNVEEAVRQWGQPSLVYTHHPGDLNIDHELTHRAVLTCFRPEPSCAVQEIRTFEVLSSTGWQGSRGAQFAPNIFVDISMTIEKKFAALKAYSDEVRSWPHARSIEAVQHLAEIRGSLVGLQFAESFQLERVIA